jgi:hypothetical protein
MYKYLLFFYLALILSAVTLAQELDSSRLEIILPDIHDWKDVTEGETLNIRISAKGGKDNNYSYSYKSGMGNLMRMDHKGNFWWPVKYNIVESVNSPQPVAITFFVVNNYGEKDSTEVLINIYNKEVKLLPEGKMVIEFGQSVGWNLLNEGDTLDFHLKARIGNAYIDDVEYYLEGDEDTDIVLDSTGRVTWVPSYDFVDRLQQTRDKHIIFVAENKSGGSASEKVVFTIFHKNRPPVVGTLPIFYVIQGTNNSFQLPGNRVMDPDGDPVVVIPELIKLPQGATLSSKGRFSWKPSRLQFSHLLDEPIRIEFFVEDQPNKARTTGILHIEASKLDLPPEITAIPSDTIFEIHENQFVNLNFYLGDPNGDDDVATFDFVSDVPGITNEALIKNTNTQYEFVWEPGFDFVTDPDQFRMVHLRFFAFDQSRNTTELLIRVKVLETRNMIRIDQENYAKYHDILTRSLDLLDQLDENLKILEKKLKKAKKGKKNRALVSASFGAATGLAPLLLEDDPQKVVSAVGGTTVMTMGTLEARDAVGESLDEIGSLIKINVQLRNKLQNDGDGFARRYNTKSSRRNENFSFDLDKLKSNLNDPNIVKLELDPTWENPKEINDRRLKQSFSDFKPQSN